MKKYEVIGVKGGKPSHFAGYYNSKEEARSVIEKYQDADPDEHLMIATLDLDDLPYFCEGSQA